MASSSASDDARSSGDLEFLRARVARHLGLVGSLSAAFYLFRVAFLLSTTVPLPWLDTSMNAHLVAAIALLAGWAFNKRPRPTWAVRTSEALSTILACIAYGVMTTGIPLIGRPDFILMMIFTSVLLSRAVMIPDTWRGTTALGVLMGVELVGSVAYLYQNVPAEFRHAVDALNGSPDVPPSMSWQLAMTVGIIPWWVMFVVIAASTSAVIYGLRTEVKEVRRLGQYRLIRKIGEGGMGVVFEATHAMLRRPTAIKVLQPDRVGEESLRRFEREVRATARLRHPNTVTVFDFGRTPDGLFYYAMELVEGGTLDRVVELSGPMPAARVIHLIHQAAGALAEAHQAKMVHRDIKPANLLLTEEGGLADVVKVVDFGLVRHAEPAPAADRTQDGALLGTPHYMAPESIRGDDADGRSDLYALGCVAFFLLTGERVFDGKTIVEVCSKHLVDAPDTPSLRLGESVPDGLEALVMALLEKTPEARPESAEAVQLQLEQLPRWGEWTRVDARTWWNEFGPDLLDRPDLDRETSTSDTLELAVDLGRRT